MRILGAMLGGTISSKNVSGTVTLGESSFARECLVSNFPSYEFVFPDLPSYSSENATPEIYREALKRITAEVKSSSYDGILIAHGTDTCAYFAQLCARVLHWLNIPFVITGSVKSPDIDPDEASENLISSVKSLEMGMSGVMFRNREGDEQLYNAHLIMSPDINGFYDEFEDGVMPEIKDRTDFLSGSKLPEILVIPAVPGAVIPNSGFDRVLICCNHSGTASTDLIPKVEQWVNKGIPCYMAPIPNDCGIYESRKRLTDVGAVELCGMPIEGAWAEVLLK